MLKPKAWRDQLGFTQERMGAYVGVSRTAWVQYERGIRVPPLDVIVRCQQLSDGRVTVDSWLAVTLDLPKRGPGRLAGVQLPARFAYAACA